MQVWKKFSAIALALVMSLALCAPAFAGSVTPPANLNGGVIGNYTEADTQNLDNKKINIQKEITVYNPSESYVYGPAITYTYEIAAATSSEELKNVTDAANLHDPAQAVTKTVLAGVIDNVTMSGTTTNTIAWTNADILEASATGTANYKNLTIDFTNVVFTEPGIYRYKITETATTYTTSGVIDGNGDTANIRYLDVYVMRSATYDATTNDKDDWKIYGYVCIPAATVIDATNNSTTSVKTNGFVNSAASGSNADQYHTYNLTVSKKLDGDTTMESHKFPFDVEFANTATGTTGTFQLIAKVTGNAEVATTDQVAAKTVNGADIPANTLKKAKSSTNADTAVIMASYDITGLKIPHNGSVTFIGIPDKTTYTVTEENDVAGTTYSTTATEAIGNGEATPVAFAESSTGARFNENKAVSVYNTQKAVYAKGDTAPAIDNDVLIAFTNKLALISPTGVTLRYAPYLAMMGAGIVALPLSLRKKEEEI